jgi:hypothetical protein
MTTTARALVERLAEVMPGRCTLFIHVEHDEEVHRMFVELVKLGETDPRQTRPPHLKANDDRVWLGADVQVGTTCVLISGPMRTRLTAAEAR